MTRSSLLTQVQTCILLQVHPNRPFTTCDLVAHRQSNECCLITHQKVTVTNALLHYYQLTVWSWGHTPTTPLKLSFSIISVRLPALCSFHAVKPKVPVLSASPQHLWTAWPFYSLRLLQTEIWWMFALISWVEHHSTTLSPSQGCYLLNTASPTSCISWQFLELASPAAADPLIRVFQALFLLFFVLLTRVKLQFGLKSAMNPQILTHSQTQVL